jgi:hypothetical protein
MQIRAINNQQRQQNFGVLMSLTEKVQTYILSAATTTEEATALNGVINDVAQAQADNFKYDVSIRFNGNNNLPSAMITDAAGNIFQQQGLKCQADKIANTLRYISAQASLRNSLAKVQRRIILF